MSKLRLQSFLLKVVALMLSGGAALSATVCVGPSATGSGNGSDWNNRKVWTATYARGETWYIIGGTYAGKTFNTADNGTVGVIKKATVADHGGISTGWVDSLDATQASFTGTITIGTSNWQFDGNKFGTTIWNQTSTNYGILFNGVAPAFAVFNTSAAITNITISGVSGIGPGGDIEKLFVMTDNSTKAVGWVTIQHCLIDGYQNAYWATSPGLVMDSWVFQYNSCKNGFGSSANHGEWINNNFGLMTNQIVRYNWFKGPTSGFTGVIVANNNDIKAPQIYGNVFDGYDSGNGIISGTSGGTIFNAQIHHNTFLNCGVGLCGNVAGSSCVFSNNLIYNEDAGIQTGFTHNDNWFRSCTSVPTESAGQTGSGNPFTDAANGDFTPIVNSTAGATLGSPYNIDPYGTTRATPTRGAFEFGSTQGDTTHPTLVSATIPAAGNVLNLVFSETVTFGAGGNAGLALTMSGGGVETLTYVSGSGSSTLVYSLGPTVLIGETKVSGLDYTQPGSGIQDTVANDLVTFTGAAVTNNSTVSGGGAAANPIITSGAVSTSGGVRLGL